MLTAVITLGIVAVLLVAAIIASVRYFLRVIRENEDAMSLERISWTEERRELLNRVQRPEYVPVSPVENFQIPELEPDELELVGTIKFEEGGE